MPIRINGCRCIFAQFRRPPLCKQWLLRALIETVEAVENIEEICSVDGVDLIIPAQFDLSTALGVSGKFEHPDFIEALEKIEKAAIAANIPLGGVGMSKEQADALFAKDYRIIAGFDLLMLKASVAAIASWTKT